MAKRRPSRTGGVQRDYAAEYRARSKERIAETRAERAKKFGFSSYGQFRSSADKITREFQSLTRREIWDKGPPEQGSALWKSLMETQAIIKGYSPEQRRRADEKHESLLGRTKEGRAVRARLRKLLDFKGARGWGSIYFSVMRTAY